MPLYLIPKYQVAVVGYPHDIKGNGLYCYVSLKVGTQSNENLKKN